eukprot:Em0179g6a
MLRARDLQVMLLLLFTPGHSESDEEIDVVTVIERPKKQPLRKRNVSVSAPCSLQNSPVGSPVKKRRYSAKRLQRLSSVGSNVTDNGESDDEQRRASHNILERKRRNDLKYSFQILRGQIPELEDNQKAPKGNHFAEGCRIHRPNTGRSQSSRG